MANPERPRVHPLALISPEAELADTVMVGPLVVIEGSVRLGPGCVVQSRAHLCGPLTLGRDNVIGPGVVLGEAPQDFKYDGEPTGVEIGDGNVFQARATVHRGTGDGGMTRIGHRNRFGAASHVGHDGRVGDECVLGDGVLLGGHCTLGDGVYLAGNSAVHQGIRIGRLARLEVCATTTKDMPPFLRQGRINAVLGINEDGMRQAGLTEAEIDGVRRAFAILFSGSTLPAAVFRIEEELPPSPALHELITFLASCTRGINRPREAAAETPARAAVPVA